MWTQNARTSGIAKVAQQAAAQQGRYTFVAHLTPEPTQNKVPSSMEQWAETIEAIEAHGWALQHFAIHGDKTEAYCVFRRR